MDYQDILLIDDDDDDQEIFIAALKKLPCSIKCTALSNAKEALEKLNGKALHPQLIFLDLNMPVMNGQQFLFEIKKDDVLKTIPVIIISTSSHPATIKLTKEMGAHEFITKPNRFDELVAILQTILC